MKYRYDKDEHSNTLLSLVGIYSSSNHLVSCNIFILIYFKINLNLNEFHLEPIITNQTLRYVRIIAKESWIYKPHLCPGSWPRDQIRKVSIVILPFKYKWTCNISSFNCFVHEGWPQIQFLEINQKCIDTQLSFCHVSKLIFLKVKMKLY